MIKSNKKTILEALGRNPIHPFPARMAPGIALDALGASRVPLNVLDPMSGSGTVLAVAQVKGHHAYGVDLDPLAVLLARVWTRPINAEQIKVEASKVHASARTRFFNCSVAKAYPNHCNEETKKFIRYWFDPYARRQLEALSFYIKKIRNEPVRDLLWCAFSRLIITKQAGASLAMDLSHSRPHKKFKYAPLKPFNRFIDVVNNIVVSCPKLEIENTFQGASVLCGDARKLEIADNSIDLVLTSPPYLNAIDYMRCSKFSLVWMGYNISDLRKIRNESVGTEASSKESSNVSWIKEIIKQLNLNPMLSLRHQALLSKYIWDMNASLSEVSRVLRSEGRAVYVVGDSTVRGTFISNSNIVTALARRHNLVLTARHTRTLPANRRYLPPPTQQTATASMNARMRREVVLSYRKASEFAATAC